MMTMQLLAEAAAAPDTMISGKWLLAIIPAVIAALGAVWVKAKNAGIREATNNITIQSPVPEVTTRSAKQYAENAALLAHEGRTAESLAQVAQDIDQIHTRINAAFHKLDTLDGSVEGIREITGKLLDLALHLPQGTSAIRSRKPCQ